MPPDQMTPEMKARLIQMLSGNSSGYQQAAAQGQITQMQRDPMPQGQSYQEPLPQQQSNNGMQDFSKMIGKLAQSYKQNQQADNYDANQFFGTDVANNRGWDTSGQNYVPNRYGNQFDPRYGQDFGNSGLFGWFFGGGDY